MYHAMYSSFNRAMTQDSISSIILAYPFRTKARLLALDDNIYKLRLDKLKQIEALGQRTYPTKYEFSHTIPQILTEYSSKSGEQLESPGVNVRVAGRIM